MSLISLADAADDDDGVDLAELTKNWTPKAKAEAMAQLRARTSKERRVWYCASPGRLCDGKPHEGYDYPHARSDQWPPGDLDWFVWLLIGGRGSGKTRSGAEFIRKMSKSIGRVALIAPTSADVRDTMIEGDSGLIAVCEKAGEKVKWEPSKRRLTFANGCIAGTFTAEEPDRLRGPQHGLAWLDEPAHMPLIDDVWDMMLLGLRLGKAPKIAMTTTPRPTKWLKARIKEENTRTVRVSTYANIDNLAPTFRKTVLDRYEGTRLGRQELHGEVLEDVEGALWQPEIIRYIGDIDLATMDRIVVAIDPAGTSNNRSDETGILVGGRRGDFAYIFEDLTGKFSPQGWSDTATRAYDKYGADAIVAEKNFGGDMVKTTIESSLKARGGQARIIVATASRSKAIRAEPIVALYEQGRVYHVTDAGHDLTKLEDEQLTWVPGEGPSPNRVDAIVWLLTELMKPNGEVSIATPSGTSLRQKRPGESGPRRRR